MVIIRKKTLGKKDYYYIEHSIRFGKSVQKKELYLGLEIPTNIESIKKEFIMNIYRTEWQKKLDIIKQEHKQEWSKLPDLIKTKEQESFAVKFTYDSQAIEGSTLTLRETSNLLLQGITPGNKPLRDVKEAEAHQKVFLDAIRESKDVSLGTTVYWHKHFFSGTKPDIAGKIRTHGVAIAGSKFVPPSPVELELLLHEFFSWYRQNKSKTHPVELAALVHLKFVTIHPFGDGNGRISRIMMNVVLHKNEYPMFDIPYNNRNSYYSALERAQIKVDETIFVHWFVKQYIKEFGKKY